MAHLRPKNGIGNLLLKCLDITRKVTVDQKVTRTNEGKTNACFSQKIINYYPCLPSTNLI